jgi:hypothetical protein
MTQDKYVQAVYGWYYEDDNDGGREGNIAAIIDGKLCPLIGRSRVAMERVRLIAQAHANALGRPIKLLKFSAREELEVCQPEGVKA